MKSTRIFAAVLVAALALSCKSNSDVKVDVELPTHAEVDSVSYLLGINFGSFLKGNDLCDNLSELNMSELKKGMNDFLKAEGSVYDPEFGKQFKINPEDMGRIINGYLSKKNEYTAAVNKAKGEKFLAENLKNGVEVTESGLQYTIIEEGDEYKVQPNDTVWVFYSGKSSTAIWTARSLHSSLQTASSRVGLRVSVFSAKAEKQHSSFLQSLLTEREATAESSLTQFSSSMLR